MRYLLLILCSLLQAKSLELNLTARAAVLMNAETGAILYEKNGHTMLAPASVTKTATALYLLESQKLRPDQIIKVSHEAIRSRPSEATGDPHWLIPDGTIMGLKRGEEISVEALLHGLMLISGNDAANVLAEAHSGSVPRFVNELNDYLRQEIGCSDTHFSNPHGIHDKTHYSSAYDLCLIAQRALKLPKFREIVSKVVYECPKTNKRPAMEIRQFNALLKKGKHYYPHAIGIKTGYHSNAMHSLVAAAEQNGRTLIAAVLGCSTSKDRFTEAKMLFEAAYHEKKEQRPLMTTDRIFTREIAGAKAPLQASLCRDLEISYYPAEEPECKAFVQWESLSLPIQKGQKVGEVHIFDQQGKNMLTGELIAKQEVKGSFWFMLKKKIGDFLSGDKTAANRSSSTSLAGHRI